MSSQNAPGDRPEVIGKTGICWTRNCNEDFRTYWRKILAQVLPRFPNADDMVINIGVTINQPHVVYKNRWNKLQVIRLQSPDDINIIRASDYYTLAHEITHYLHDEQWTDLYASAHAPRSRDLGVNAPLGCGYFPEARRAIKLGLEDAVADLAAMSLHYRGNRQMWFESRLLELEEELRTIEWADRAALNTTAQKCKPPRPEGCEDCRTEMEERRVRITITEVE